MAGERATTGRFEDAGWEPVGTTQRTDTNFGDDILDYRGQPGIDGVFVRRDADGNVVEFAIVETKATGSGEAGSLRPEQMSQDWLLGRLEDNRAGLTNAEYQSLYDQISAGNLDNVTLVKADVTGVRTDDNGRLTGTPVVEFTELTLDGRTGVTVGDPWQLPGEN